MECRCLSVSGYDDNGLFEESYSPTNRTFVAVDGGDTFTIGIEAESGEVFGWGRAFYGELLVDPVGKKKPVVKLDLPEQCKAVACGPNHVLTLAYSGRVFAWGCNRSGQVAVAKADEVVRAPTIVQFFLNTVHIVEVAAGGMHSLALCLSGRVWAWGCNAYGQLGIGAKVKQLNTPAIVALPVKIQAQYIAAGWAHNAVISTSGDVFTFGWGLYSQLGHGSTQNELQPLAVEALKGLDSGISQVACGNWHTAALTVSGDLYTWGWGMDGQLGPEASAIMHVLPRVVNILSSSTSDDNEDVTAIACGNRFTVALCKNNFVHYWGPRPATRMSQSIQICLRLGWPHQSIHRICKLAAGYSHVILLLEHENQKARD